MEIDSMEKKRESFDEHKECHQVVNLERLFLLRSNYMDPNESKDEEYDGKGEVYFREWNFTSWKVDSVVGVIVLLSNVDW